MKKLFLGIGLFLVYSVFAGDRGAAYKLELEPTSQAYVFGDRDHFTWGASPIRGNDGKYHLFYSRWEKRFGFSAWVTRSEIAHAVAEKAEGPYRFRDITLPARGKAYWDGLTTHNPTIHFFEGKYYLYYMGTTGNGKITAGLNMDHRNRQRIGLAVAESPNGPWTRFDRPLIDVSKDDSAPDALMISNPSVTRMPDGRYLMVYKAVGKKIKGLFGGPVVHLCAIATSPAGPFSKVLKPIFIQKGISFPAEDPYIWCEDGIFYALVKDMRGSFTRAGRSLALFFSKNGLDWTPTQDPLVSRTRIRWQGGETTAVRNLERPQLLIENGKPTLIFLAVFPGKDRKNLPPVPTFNIHFKIKDKDSPL